MVSFDELETFLAFFVFLPSGKALIRKDFRDSEDVKAFPPAKIHSLLNSAYEISQGLGEESIDEGEIYHVDFSSIRIAGISRPEGLLFSLVSSSSASILDIEFKLRTIQSLFLGMFADKLTKKIVRISGVEKEEFDETIRTVMSGESRYMSESIKRVVDEHLDAWILSEDSVRGICVSSFTGAIIVNQMDSEILPAAIRAIRGAFAAQLEKPKYFLTVSGDANIFVYILGAGLLLLVDTSPDSSPVKTVSIVERIVEELRNLIL